MSKIKITMASGSSIEKPLVTCFKGTNGDYIIFDNETNGQMGYPIICISKFNGTSVDKVTDPGEWNSIKENLKTIIAGTALPYLAVPDTLTAPDDFFTQLTLPVASFDLLKNVYSAPAVVEPVKQPNDLPSEPVAATPEVAPAPVIEPTAIGESPIIAPAPVIENPVAAPVASEPVMAAPVIDMAANVAPVSGPTASLEPAPLTTPVVEAAPVTPVSTEPIANNNEIEALKESFMKSCENMFDALIKKIENKN